MSPGLDADSAVGEQTRAGTDTPEPLVGEDDEEMKAAFEKWKSKSFALTVPLRIVSLRGSIPPSWIKVLSFFFHCLFANKLVCLLFFRICCLF